MPAPTRDEIEQAIARGASADWIWDVLGADPLEVDRVLARMDAISCDEPVADDVMPHGTHTGYNRHRLNGEEPCAACVEGERDYHRQRDGRSTRPLMPCGTYSAYVRHRNHGETPDTACIDAQRAYAREAKQRQKHRRLRAAGRAA